MAVNPVTEFRSLILSIIFLKLVTAPMGNDVLIGYFLLLKVIYIKAVPTGMHTHIYQEVIFFAIAFLFAKGQRFGMFGGINLWWLNRARAAYQLEKQQYNNF